MVLRLRGNAIGRVVTLSREVIVFSLSPTAKSQYRVGWKPEWFASSLRKTVLT